MCYQSLTVGDTVHVPYQTKEYELEVVKLSTEGEKDALAVSIADTDLLLTLLPPKDTRSVHTDIHMDEQVEASVEAGFFSKYLL